MTESAFAGSVFVGGDWENGFGLKFNRAEDGSVWAETSFSENKTGPSGIAHGGAIAAVLDEAMTAVIFAAGRRGFTANLNVNYKAAIPIGARLKIIAYIEQIEGRKTFTAARILLSDGQLAAEGFGLFISTAAMPDRPIQG